MTTSPAIREVFSVRGRYSPLAVFRSGWRERRLILRLARRQIEARYRGSVLGIVWSVVVPLTMLGVYSFVFGVVFESRWRQPPAEPVAQLAAQAPVAGATAPAASADPRAPKRYMGPFVLVLFTGLLLFNLFAESVNRAPGLMLENVTYIKKVIFPLEILTWVTVAVALFNALVSALVLLAGYVIFRGLPPPASVLCPVVLIPLILLTVGLSWFLSSFGVYFRDLQQFIPVLTTILMFLSPVFYPSADFQAKLPIWAWPLMDLNPIAASVESARGALFLGQWPSWKLLGLHTLIGWLIAWLGLAWFTKTRKGFADVV